MFEFLTHFEFNTSTCVILVLVLLLGLFLWKFKQFRMDISKLNKMQHQLQRNLTNGSILDMPVERQPLTYNLIEQDDKSDFTDESPMPKEDNNESPIEPVDKMSLNQNPNQVEENKRLINQSALNLEHQHDTTIQNLPNPNDLQLLKNNQPTATTNDNNKENEDEDDEDDVSEQSSIDRCDEFEINNIDELLNNDVVSSVPVISNLPVIPNLPVQLVQQSTVQSVNNESQTVSITNPVTNSSTESLVNPSTGSSTDPAEGPVQNENNNALVMNSETESQDGNKDTNALKTITIKKKST